MAQLLLLLFPIAFLIGAVAGPVLIPGMWVVQLSHRGGFEKEIVVSWASLIAVTLSQVYLTCLVIWPYSSPFRDYALGCGEVLAVAATLTAAIDLRRTETTFAKWLLLTVAASHIVVWFGLWALSQLG